MANNKNRLGKNNYFEDKRKKDDDDRENSQFMNCKDCEFCKVSLT